MQEKCVIFRKMGIKNHQPRGWWSIFLTLKVNDERIFIEPLVQGWRSSCSPHGR